MLAAMQAQHAHFLEQQKGLEARMRLQEERYLQARAPTHVEIIRERVVPTTHVHPVVAQPDAAAEQRAQLAAALSGMRQTLSDHATRHAGDMRETVRGWLNDVHSIWNRPPPAPGAPEAGIVASSGSPPGPPPPPAAGAVPSRGTRVPAGIAAAASSAATHAAPETTRRRERSRSPSRAGESRDTVERAARGPAKTARVTKPKAIPPPRPRRYGPRLAPESAPASPPPPPPPTPQKKRKAPEEEAPGAPPAPAPRPRAKARPKAMAASLPDHLRRRSEPEPEPEAPPAKRRRTGFAPPKRPRRGRAPFVIAAA